jgi:hypothetical protein
MNRSVVTHQRTAWCRSHRATSRCTAGSDCRWCGCRGEKGRVGDPASYDGAVPAVPARPKRCKSAARSRCAAESPATSGSGIGSSPAFHWTLYDTAQSHGADGPSWPALPAWFARAGGSGNLSALRTALAWHALAPTSPGTAGRRWSPAKTAPPQTSGATTLWCPAASESSATASGTYAGATRPPATPDWSPHSHYSWKSVCTATT